MTLTGIRNQIIAVLVETGLFSLKDDAAKIKVTKSLYGIKEELVVSACKLLEEAKYVEKISREDDTFWILEEDFSTKPQNVTISPALAGAICNVINQYREALGIKEGECNRLSISEEDIHSLIVICGALLNNVEKKSEPDDDPDYGTN